MNKLYYWWVLAVYDPEGNYHGTSRMSAEVRFTEEKCATPQEACKNAFGCSKNIPKVYYAKRISTRRSDAQKNSFRKDSLNDPANWIKCRDNTTAESTLISEFLKLLNK